MHRKLFTRHGHAFSTQFRRVLSEYIKLTLLVEELLDLMLKLMIKLMVKLMIKLLTLLVEHLLSEQLLAK